MELQVGYRQGNTEKRVNYEGKKHRKKCETALVSVWIKENVFFVR